MDWEIADKADLSRERGILTKSDREFLTGDSDIEPESHSERKSRERIRNRTKNALLDMWLLFEELEQRDLEQIFMPENDARSDSLAATSRALAFIFDGVGAHRLMQPSKPHKDPSEESLRRALELVGRKHEYFVQEVELEIEADRIPVKRLFRDLEEENELPPEALRFLLELDEVDTSEVQDSIRDMVLEENE